MEKKQNNLEQYINIAAGLLILTGLYMTSLYSYLLFHNISELFSIIVACGIFMVAWNSRKYMESNYLVFIAIAYLFVAGLDLLHTLSYKGMQIFKDYDYYANQLWIGARYLESISLLAAFIYIKKERTLNPYIIFSIYMIIFSIIVMSVFYWKIFPVCFIEGQGLTPFKKISEYIICFILFIDITLLFQYRDKFEKNVFQFLVCSLFCTIIAELAFTFYISNYGFSNLVGHYFKIFSFYMIYKAIIETGIVKPHDIIFRELILKEHKLKEARDAADVANKAKSEFLANMSHELRTPLNGILGYAQILKLDPSLSKSQRGGVDVIERSGRHLLNLINEVLDLSKIEARKMEIHESVINFSEFLKNIVNIINVRAKQKKILFFSEFDKNLPVHIAADEKRLSQILLNILGNAVKFTRQGKVVFTVQKLENKEDSQFTRIYFQIEDTGIGIEENQIEDIFSPFKQVGEFSRTIEGTGLGLSISQKLVKMMGSRLDVTSTPGKGSVFSFVLQLKQSFEPLEEKESYHKKITGIKDKKKILIVDDQEANRSVLISLLSPLGFEIMEACDGREGFQKALEFLPDLIFMDLVMPKSDGFEATRNIRNSPELQHARVVAVSASSFLSPQEIIAKSNFDGFIPKPVQIQEIFKSLETHLSIEWLYEESKNEQDDNIPVDNDDFSLPPLVYMEKLYRAVRGGDIVMLRKQLDDMENENKKYISFVTRIRKLADAFQILNIRELLEKYMGKNK
ncbi:MASE3 domain-containing protein [Desulfonema limicola]|nr:MASE3 domain-containing protein [Desulfonema limicola]